MFLEIGFGLERVRHAVVLTVVNLENPLYEAASR